MQTLTPEILAPILKGTDLTTVFLPHYTEQTVATSTKIASWRSFLEVDQTLFAHTAFVYVGADRTYTFIAVYNQPEGTYFMHCKELSMALSVDMYFQAYREYLAQKICS